MNCETVEKCDSQWREIRVCSENNENNAARFNPCPAKASCLVKVCFLLTVGQLL